MNNRKIDFIICVNNDRQFQEACFYIGNLEVPPGYQIDILEIRDAVSIFSGYNEGMRASNAKYKIYMHQDVRIIDKNFILIMLEKFQDPQIGMIGVVGSAGLYRKPWQWDAGAVVETRIDRTYLERFSGGDSDLYVKQIDGLLMATQYDLYWREDLFRGWDIYDCSQSCEFLRAGYKIIVPAQKQAICLHDCGYADLSDYFQEREKFLACYTDMIDEETDDCGGLP